jgi:hypothetical protein
VNSNTNATSVTSGRQRRPSLVTVLRKCCMVCGFLRIICAPNAARDPGRMKGQNDDAPDTTRYPKAKGGHERASALQSTHKVSLHSYIVWNNTRLRANRICAPPQTHIAPTTNRHEETPKYSASQVLHPNSWRPTISPCPSTTLHLSRLITRRLDIKIDIRPSRTTTII